MKEVENIVDDLSQKVKNKDDVEKQIKELKEKIPVSLTIVKDEEKGSLIQIV